MKTVKTFLMNDFATQSSRLQHAEMCSIFKLKLFDAVETEKEEATHFIRNSDSRKGGNG